jgi:hypothetical protein
VLATDIVRPERRGCNNNCAGIKSTVVWDYGTGAPKAGSFNELGGAATDPRVDRLRLVERGRLLGEQVLVDVRRDRVAPPGGRVGLEHGYLVGVARV